MLSSSDPQTPHYEPDWEVRSDDGKGESFYEVVDSRLNRRDLLKAGFAGLVASALFGGASTSSASKGSARAAGRGMGLSFPPISSSTEDLIRVPSGYRAETVIAWGDSLKEGIPKHKDGDLSAKNQSEQFGYNCDFVGYHPLPFGSKNSTHGLLSVNHEYVNPELMFAGWDLKKATVQQVEFMKAAVGMAVVEVKQDEGGAWRPVQASPYNARYTAEKIFEVTGPARGHDWMKTSSSPDGTKVRGTFSNCSAGRTPWGTVLSGEENFQDNFANGSSITDPEAMKSAARYGYPAGASEYGWEHGDPRFDISKEPNEPNHFGWVVEIDPYDPNWTPKKRTALGRFRHEAATTFVSPKGRVVMYSGCDSRFEYVFKFVSAKSFNKSDRLANRDLMDEGVLYAARYNADGTGDWLPLAQGQGPLTPENGFRNQGDVVIKARIAADLLGATKMDRPEDIEVNPVNKKVYVVCTNNVDRAKDGKPTTDTSNPRKENKHGHIIEMIEAGNDHASTTFKWELFLVCGDPNDPSTYFAGFDKSQVAAISCPDNIVFDLQGNLWIATDGQPKTLAIHDGVYAVAVEGPERGKVKQFMSSVKGAEVCGPEFTPDNKTLFLAIQHPGEGSTFEKPSTSWPNHSGVARPAVVAITHTKGKRIGS